MKTLPYDVFTQAFLDKITEFHFPKEDFLRNGMVDRFMKRAMSQFRHICIYDFSTTADDVARVYTVEVKHEDIDELADIVSEGMIVEWLSYYKYENLENLINTRDFTSYSPANLLSAIKETYMQARKNFTNKMREYSYCHGDLSDLHL